jgi:hypothetical protein
MSCALFDFFRVYKLQYAESRMKYKSFPLEAADYLAGMTFEETHEEDDVEAADPSPPTPHAPRRGPAGRLSADMKEHQLQLIVAVGKKKSTETLQSVCGLQKM